MHARRIVFVGQTYYPDSSSTGQLCTPLLESFAAHGIPVLVICGFPTGLGANGIHAIPRRENRHGVEIVRCGWRINPKRGFVHRAFSYASYLFGTFVQLLRLRRSDLVYAISNPPFNAIIVWIASCVRGFRYQYMILDAYPEGLIALGKISPTSWVARIWRWANRKAYHRASRMLVLGRDMLERLDSYEVPRERRLYIPHWSVAEKSKVKTFEESELQQRLKLCDKFVVQYSGNMGLWHDMVSIVEAAKLLSARKDIHFLLIGDGLRRAEAQRLSDSLQLDNVTWLDFVPLENLADSLAGCHASLISLREGLEGIAVPCKLYGILASGRAIVAQVPAKSEVALTILEDACGLVIPPGDAAKLAEGIRELADDRTRTLAMGERARQAYLDKYQLEHAVAKFEDLWEISPSVLGPNRISAKVPV